jgi:Subtilase family
MSAIIVQFSAVLTTPDSARLRAEYDLTLDRYIPEQGYLERLPPATVDRVRSDFLVRSCTPLDPTLKLSPSIRDVQAAPGSPAEFNAILFDDASSAQVKAALENAGAENVTVIDDRDFGGQLGLTFLLDDLARLDEIAALEEIVWLEPVWPIAIQSTNVEAAKTLQSGIPGESPVWANKLCGEGMVIGVIDRGILDIDHGFFADALYPRPNKPGPKHRKVLAIFNESGGAVEDHPSRVCGIAAGDALGNSGANVNRGSAWNAKLVYTNINDAYKQYRTFPYLIGKYRSLHYLLNQAKEAGAVIHSCSFTEITSGVYDKAAREVDAFTWANEDHLLVAGGANTGAGVNAPPGTAKNGLCVAAAKAFPDNMSRGSGVSGPTVDGRRKPEIMAIGGELEMVMGNWTGTLAGFHTSYATPHVAAAAALVRQYFVDGFYPFGQRDPNNSFGFLPTGALIKAVLLNATVDMTGEPGYPSDAEGWGLIRLSNTLFFKDPPGKRRLAVNDVRRATGLDVGDSLSAYDHRRTHKIIVNDSAEQLKITLVWTDPPPSEASFKSPSVNSLKLEAAPKRGVLAPLAGHREYSYVGNDIDTATGLSRRHELSRALDAKNNVHMIIVNNPPVGEWTITVSTQSILVGDKPYRQGYALVASGGLDQMLGSNPIFP